jgi:hypothetical protein
MTINIWTFFFVVVFNNQYATSVEYETLEKCLTQQYSVEKDSSLLYIEYGCVKRIRRYVEQCELLPMDYVNKKECIPYWDHWANNRR